MTPDTIKISQLPSDSTPGTSDLVPLVNGGTLQTEQATLGSILALVATGSDGWTALPYTPNSVTYNGNRSYSFVFNSVNLTGTLSNRMQVKTTRTVSAPTQCTSLNGSTQNYSKSSPAGMTFVDDFATGIWIKATSYALSDIESRYNGTSGWELQMSATGQITLIGRNASSANFSYVQTVQSIPLNKWVHIGAQLDMSSFTVSSTTSYIMFDGVDMPCTVARGGTNPTALVQAGNLEIGSTNGGATPFPGKIAQAFVTSAKVTQANMRTVYSQGITSSDITNLSIISAYSFNNSINDLNTTNANNLTANGSAVATNADSPFTQDDTGTPSGTTDFGVITGKTFSTNTTLTVQVPEGCTIPTSGGVSAVSYSSQASPYGFPSEKDRWRITSFLVSAPATTSNATFGSFISGGWKLSVPVGCWDIGWQAGVYSQTNTPIVWAVSPTDLTGLAIGQGNAKAALSFASIAPSGSLITLQVHIERPQTLTSVQTFVMYTYGATTSAGLDGINSTSEIFAEFAYL